MFCEAELKVKQTTEEAKLASVALRLIITGPAITNHELYWRTNHVLLSFITPTLCKCKVKRVGVDKSLTPNSC